MMNRRLSLRKEHLSLRIFTALMVVPLVGIVGCTHLSQQSSQHTGHHETAHSINGGLTGADALKQELGIELVSLRVTGGGLLLDLRYRVTDPDRAVEVTKRNSNLSIHVVDTASGHELAVPLTHLGLLRTQSFRPKTDRLYYALIGNPAVSSGSCQEPCPVLKAEGLVKPGSEVSIKFGAISVDGWKVE